MDLFRTMLIFTRVVEARSFSTAAKALVLSPSSVTTAIQSLEKSFGVRLLSRTTRRVALTEAGAAYYDRCRTLLADLEQIEAQMRHAATETKGRLRVKITGWIARQVVLPVVRTFQDKFPGVALQIILSDGADDCLQECFDCAIRAGVLKDSSLVARRIGALKPVICAAPAYLSRHGEPVDLEELSGHYAVGFLPGRAGRAETWDFLVDGATVSVDMRHQLEVNESDSHVSCGLMGLGLIRAPEWQVQRYLESGRLRQVLTQLQCPPEPILIVYPHRNFVSPGVRVFIDWTANIFERTPLSRRPRLPVVSSATPYKMAQEAAPAANRSPISTDYPIRETALAPDCQPTYTQ